MVPMENKPSSSLKFQILFPFLAVLFFISCPLAKSQAVLGAFPNNQQYGTQDVSIKMTNLNGNIDLSDERDTKAKALGFSITKGYLLNSREHLSIRLHYGNGKTATQVQTKMPRNDQTTKTFGIGLSYTRLAPSYNIKYSLDFLQQHVLVAAYLPGYQKTHYTATLFHYTTQAESTIPLFWTLHLKPHGMVEFFYYHHSSWKFPGQTNTKKALAQFIPRTTVGTDLTYFFKGDQWDVEPFLRFDIKNYLVNRHPMFYQPSIFVPLLTLPDDRRLQASKQARSFEAGFTVFNNYNMSVKTTYSHWDDPIYKNSLFSFEFGMTF